MSTIAAALTPTQHTLASGAVLFHWPCPSPSPRALLLFQHGFGDYSERMIRDYPYILSDLHASDVDVWAMDMYAHGKSPGEPRAVVDVRNLVADHITARRIALAHPRSQITSAKDSSTDTNTNTDPDAKALAYRPLFLLGHSLGGLVTASSAAQDSSHLRGVILSAPALTHPFAIFIKRFVSFLASIFPSARIPLPLPSPDALTRNESQLTRWYADERAYHGQVSFLVASSALETADDLFRRVDGWETPVLVTHGDKDGFTDHGQSRRFVELVGGSDKEFYSVDGGRHDLFSDDGFEQTWGHIVQWIGARVG